MILFQNKNSSKEPGRKRLRVRLSRLQTMDVEFHRSSSNHRLDRCHLHRHVWPFVVLRQAQVYFPYNWKSQSVSESNWMLKSEVWISKSTVSQATPPLRTATAGTRKEMPKLQILSLEMLVVTLADGKGFTDSQSHHFLQGCKITHGRRLLRNLLWRWSPRPRQELQKLSLQGLASFTTIIANKPGWTAKIAGRYQPRVRYRPRRQALKSISLEAN